MKINLINVRGESSMRKIGTISLSLGCIYYGVWLALKNINPKLAEEIFKWWPMIFVILGVEILLNARINSGTMKNNFNIGIIFIILIFLCTNVYYGTHEFIEDGISNLNNGRLQINYDGNTRSIDSEKIISGNNKKFKFTTNNGVLNIKKSTDNNIRLQLEVKVSDDYKDNKYVIHDENEEGTDSVNIDDNYVKDVHGTIYVPDGIYTNLVVNNCDITTDDNLSNNTLDINSKNSKFNIQNLAAVNIETDNSDVDIKDVNSVKIEGKNIKNDLSGNIENVDIDMNNGSTDINNNNFNSIKIKADNSLVKIDTNETNIGASLTCSLGNIKFNDEKINNGTLTKSIGTGKNNMDVDIKLGSIKVNSQE